MNWFKQNLWSLIITAVSIITMASLLNYRVNLIEAKFADYPSKDWFDLKFDTIERRFNNLEESIKELKQLH